MHPNRTSLPQVTPRYTGLLIRDQYWRPLEEPVLTSVLNDMQKTQITFTDLARLLERKNEILVKQGQQPVDIAETKAALEQGGFIKQTDEESIVVVRNSVAPRAWYQSSGTGDQSFVQLTRTANPADPVATDPCTYGASVDFCCEHARRNGTNQNPLSVVLTDTSSTESGSILLMPRNGQQNGPMLLCYPKGWQNC